MNPTDLRSLNYSNADYDIRHSLNANYVYTVPNSYFHNGLKSFTVRERYKLTVGAFFFNVLNHPNFDLPVNNVALGNFGTITSTVSSPTSAYGSFQGSAVSGRVIQTQIKFTF